MYGCESWTLKKADERMIEVFELWLWRRVLRVSWRERKTNEWVRRQVEVTEQQGMLQQVKRRKLQKYGHWKRRSNSLVLATIEGEVNAKGRRGRRRIEWMDNIKEWSGGLTTAMSAAHRGNAHGSHRATAR